MSIGSASLEHIPCRWCGTIVPIIAWDIEWDMWFSTDRPTVQRCFPDMSANDREMLVSGTCSACWDRMMGMEE